MDRGTWQAVHGVMKSRTQLSTHTHTHTHRSHSNSMLVILAINQFPSKLWPSVNVLIRYIHQVVHQKYEDIEENKKKDKKQTP